MVHCALVDTVYFVHNKHGSGMSGGSKGFRGAILVGLLSVQYCIRIATVLCLHRWGVQSEEVSGTVLKVMIVVVLFLSS
jgi:hypothetical protein